MFRKKLCATAKSIIVIQLSIENNFGWEKYMLNTIFDVAISAAFNWGLMMLIANIRKKEFSKAMYITIAVVMYILEVLLIGLFYWFLLGIRGQNFSIICSGLFMGIIIGLINGWKSLQKNARLCDNKAYRELDNRKKDIDNKIKQAQDIRTKQKLKICEASINENYSYWTIDDWWEILEKQLLKIKLSDGTSGLEALLCMASEKEAFKHIKVLISKYDRCQGNLYLDDKRVFEEELNNLWENFLHKEWIDDPQWSYDVVFKNKDVISKEKNKNTDIKNKTYISNEYMFCRKCGAKMPKDSAFCASCGEKFIFVTDKCPYCGSKLLEGAKFCNKCGKGVS